MKQLLGFIAALGLIITALFEQDAIKSTGFAGLSIVCAVSTCSILPKTKL